MSICKELDEAVQKYLRTATFPVAVKTLENAEQFPERTRRPLRDMGAQAQPVPGRGAGPPLRLDHGFCEEDHSCSNSLILMGIREVPNLSKTAALSPPRIPTPWSTAPLPRASRPGRDGRSPPFCWLPSTAPILTLTWSSSTATPARPCAWCRPPSITPAAPSSPSSWGRCACATEIAVTLQTDQCQVVVPGGGEKVFGMLGDDEMVFTAPASRLRDIIRGLADSHKAGAARIPSPYYGLQAEPKFPPIYAELERCFGLRED